MNNHDSSTEAPSTSTHRAYLRRVGVGLLAALLTALALGGLAFPGASTGSVVATLAASADPASTTHPTH